MLAAFAALFPPVIYAMLRYRTFSHSLFLLAALAVEIVGHVGKVFLVREPNSHAYTAVYLMGTHWGAVLVGSAMNLALPHVLVLYGDEFRLVSEPVYLNILFFVLDVFTLAFQSVGIGFASTARTATEVSLVVSHRETEGLLANKPPPFLGITGDVHSLDRSGYPGLQPTGFPGNLPVLQAQALPSSIYPRRPVLSFVHVPPFQVLHDR